MSASCPASRRFRAWISASRRVVICADPNPLRARVLRDDPAPPLRVCALPAALDALLALDCRGMLASGSAVRELNAGSRLGTGPLQVETQCGVCYVPFGVVKSS